MKPFAAVLAVAILLIAALPASADWPLPQAGDLKGVEVFTVRKEIEGTVYIFRPAIRFLYEGEGVRLRIFMFWDFSDFYSVERKDETGTLYFEYFVKDEGKGTWHSWSTKDGYAVAFALYYRTDDPERKLHRFDIVAVK